MCIRDRSLSDPKYVKYLVDNILSTNAIVGQDKPTFGGFTNIYLNSTLNSQENFVSLEDTEKTKFKMPKKKKVSRRKMSLKDKQEQARKNAEQLKKNCK